MGRNGLRGEEVAALLHGRACVVYVLFLF